ncbi:hypothetical protein AB0L70_34625 [Kribbella sp. NPDC051952]|uniref:hypothetical protein n=1 Tax=Kribbella sp. NPDC051952 TaxID=3154851 RepID=UPI0034299220
MTDLLTRRPERPLPPGRHQQLRADLLTAIETEPARTPRRVLGPLVAAAAVLAVVAGLAVGVHAFQGDDGIVPSGQDHAQPRVKELSAKDTRKLRGQCEREADKITNADHPHPFDDFKTLNAFEFVDVKSPKVVKTWFIGSGEEVYENPAGGPGRISPIYWLCSRTAGGVISESSIRFGKKVNLFDPVTGFARNAGVFVAPVTRVTVQPKGQPEIEAVLRDGMWFAPTEGRINWGPFDADDPVTKTYVVRGYDASGRQVSSTATPGPVELNCAVRGPYTKKDGKTISPTPNPTNSPPDCKVYEWPS